MKALALIGNTACLPHSRRVGRSAPAFAATEPRESPAVYLKTTRARLELELIAWTRWDALRFAEA